MDSRPLTERRFPDRRRMISAAGATAGGLLLSVTQGNLLGTDEKANPRKRNLRIRPRYHRWHVNRGVEWIESNTDYANLDWTIPLSQTALVLVDVWDCHYLKDTEARAERIIDETLTPLLAECRKARE